MMPAAVANATARVAPTKRPLATTRAPVGATLTVKSTSQPSAVGVERPVVGLAMARSTANPPTVAAAPNQSERRSCLPETRAASGRASSSPTGMIAWTSDSDPISSAVASSAKPAI